MPASSVSALPGTATGATLQTSDFFYVVSGGSKKIRVDETLTGLFRERTALTVPTNFNFYVPSPAKARDCKVLELVDGTAGVGAPAGETYLQVRNNDKLGEVQVKAICTDSGSHAAITLIPHGTDGLRVKWLESNNPGTSPVVSIANNVPGQLAGATPYIYLQSFPASPANGMYMGGLYAMGTNSAAGTNDYGGFDFNAIDITDGAETGRFTLYACVGGTLVQQLRLADGVIVGPDYSTAPGRGRLQANGLLTPATALTIASGAITATRGFHILDTEAAAASDDLDTINGGGDGMRLVLRAANDARTVVIKNGTGNIRCESDRSLDNRFDTMELIYDSTLAIWLELHFANNGA